MRRALISIAPFLASSSVVLFAVATNATTWLPPARPLAHDEKLELAVSESDAVGLGFVVGVRETIVDVADGTGITARSLTLRPKEWLRGAVEGSTVEVALSASDHSAVFSDALLARGIETQPALFFLRRSGSGWSFRDYPDPASLQVLSSADIGPMKQRILRAISRQSPDSLLARADVIALGHRGETEACPSSSGTRECATVTITRVLAGGGVPGSLRVYSVLLGHMPRGDALYLLRAMPDGLYETVGFRDGSLPVHGGRVERWGLTLDQIRLKVRDVRAASSRRKP